MTGPNEMTNTQTHEDLIRSYAGRGADIRLRFFENNTEKIAGIALKLAELLEY